MGGAAEAVAEAPKSLLRPGDAGLKELFEAQIRGGQDSIVSAVEAIDGQKFHTDSWTREGGGGASRASCRTGTCSRRRA